MSVCDNIRISRSKIVKGKQWRGKQSSMRRYLYGVKAAAAAVKVLVTQDGIPVEFSFVPGSESDVQALKKLPLHVCEGSCIHGDAAYTDYTAEDDIELGDGVKLCIARKSNSKRPDQPWERFLKSYHRKRIETTFSEIKKLFLRKVHAVTFKGFLIKIMMFIIAFTFNKLV